MPAAADIDAFGLGYFVLALTPSFLSISVVWFGPFGRHWTAGFAPLITGRDIRHGASLEWLGYRAISRSAHIRRLLRLGFVTAVRMNGPIKSDGHHTQRWCFGHAFALEAIFADWKSSFGDHLALRRSS